MFRFAHSFLLLTLGAALLSPRGFAQITPQPGNGGGGTQIVPQSQPAGAVYISIPKPSVISHITWAGKPVFTVAAINSLVNQYSTQLKIWVFKKEKETRVL